MTVYQPECWVCKNALIIKGLHENDKIFTGCMMNAEKKPCKYEPAEFRITTSSESQK